VCRKSRIWEQNPICKRRRAILETNRVKSLKDKKSWEVNRKKCQEKTEADW